MLALVGWDACLFVLLVYGSPRYMMRIFKFKGTQTFIHNLTLYK